MENRISQLFKEDPLNLYEEEEIFKIFVSYTKINNNVCLKNLWLHFIKINFIFFKEESFFFKFFFGFFVLFGIN